MLGCDGQLLWGQTRCQKSQNSQKQCIHVVDRSKPTFRKLAYYDPLFSKVKENIQNDLWLLLTHAWQKVQLNLDSRDHLSSVHVLITSSVQDHMMNAIVVIVSVLLGGCDVAKAQNPAPPSVLLREYFSIIESPQDNCLTACNRIQGRCNPRRLSELALNIEKCSDAIISYLEWSNPGGQYSLFPNGSGRKLNSSGNSFSKCPSVQCSFQQPQEITTMLLKNHSHMNHNTTLSKFD